MADIAVLAGLAALAAVGAWIMIQVRILDVPNARSSHDRPVPRAGGIAIVVAFLVGIIWAGEGGLWVLAAAALAVALIGLADDLGGLRVWAKLAGHTAAASISESARTKPVR